MIPSRRKSISNRRLANIAQKHVHPPPDGCLWWRMSPCQFSCLSIPCYLYLLSIGCSLFQICML
ncbi:hypothetical protein BDN70DRAFT_376417 [Pholiota conissans]|uniref:Uncharacterized protein n=1 Tax=Pholiota conissans TaxID=109636 RepID=A0A9P5YTK8_9AGAR|nr:hypothetical protein BDN70DRAFT_376417 [Pholiota conissans]